MPVCSHFSRILGSFWGRLAFMGKSVFGRLSVDFRSSGTRLISPQIVDFFHYRERGENRPFATMERHSSCDEPFITADKELRKALLETVKIRVQFWQINLSAE